MPVTLKEIAAKLSLSTSLVSGVLNDRPGIWASEETRRRVKETAREMGYRPNAAAKALRSGKAFRVAFVCRLTDVPSRNGAKAGVVENLAAALAPQQYDVLIKALPDKQTLLSGLGDLVHARACDAVVLWGNEDEVEEAGIYLERSDVPFVVKGHFELEHPNWAQVEFDHEFMMREAVQHLSSLGHTRIGYLGYSLDCLYRRLLLQGYKSAMLDITGAAVPDEWIAEGIDADTDASEQVDRWLALPPDRQPTAIVVGAGNPAWEGIEQALAKRGRKIGDGPNDIAVAGESHDDMRLMFGLGMTFEGVELMRIAEVMADEILLPMLNGAEPRSRIVRLQPGLCPVRSMQLLNHDALRALLQPSVA